MMNIFRLIKAQFVFRLIILLVLIFLALVNVAVAQAPKRLAVRAARMLDVKSGVYINNPVVLIEGEQITDVGSNIKIPSGTETIDLGNATLLPGLIDSHTHLLSNFNPQYGGDELNSMVTVLSYGTPLRTLLGAKMAREMLEAGFTTVRDLGNAGLGGDVALSNAINLGWTTGPRMFVATRALSAAGGQFYASTPEMQKVVEAEYVVIAGTDDARRAVRQALYEGADCIKVIVNTDTRVLSLEEMKVIVEEAHRVNKKVAAHATRGIATKIAAEAGVDSIEHAYTIPDDVLQIMAQKKIFLVPTDYPGGFFAELFLPYQGLTSEQMKQRIERSKQSVIPIQQRLARAIKAGVRIAAGSDEYYNVPGKTRGQAALVTYRAYLASGMRPLDIIRAATISNAELLAGEEAQFEIIEKGKFADIIAVPGDPLKDITELEKVSFVMKGGAVIKK